MKEFFRNLKGFLKGWWHVNISEKDVVYSFYGFNHFNLAKRYADMRLKRNGLKHWVLPAGKGSEMLIVFNTREKDSMQAQNLMNRRITAYDLSKGCYYIAEQKRKKK